MLKAINKFVVVKLLPSELLKTGIVLPTEQVERFPKAEVLSVGEEAKYLKVGDKIVFERYNQQEMTMDGEKILVLREEEILGKVE